MVYGDAAAVVPEPSEPLGPAEQGHGLQQTEDQVQVKYEKTENI